MKEERGTGPLSKVLSPLQPAAAYLVSRRFIDEQIILIPADGNSQLPPCLTREQFIGQSPGQRWSEQGKCGALSVCSHLQLGQSHKIQITIWTSCLVNKDEP